MSISIRRVYRALLFSVVLHLWLHFVRRAHRLIGGYGTTNLGNPDSLLRPCDSDLEAYFSGYFDCDVDPWEFARPPESVSIPSAASASDDVFRAGPPGNAQTSSAEGEEAAEAEEVNSNPHDPNLDLLMGAPGAATASEPYSASVAHDHNVHEPQSKSLESIQLKASLICSFKLLHWRTRDALGNPHNA